MKSSMENQETSVGAFIYKIEKDFPFKNKLEIIKEINGTKSIFINGDNKLIEYRKKLNDLKSEIYPKSKSEECKVIPVIIAPKNNL